jgi:uncharacterized protein (TIGR02677 family)
LLQEAAGAFVNTEDDRDALTRTLAVRWRHRWQGLQHWFVGVGRAAQVQQLRQAASAAIPRLLALAAQLHDRRVTHSDRRAELIELACWFVDAADDRQAHRLWRAAFGNSPSRHLKVNQTTLDERDHQPTPAATSWLDAPPVYISPQLRQKGRAPVAAPSRRIIDRQGLRAEVRRRLNAEVERTWQARDALLSLGRRRLSEVGQLEHEALLLLIDLLDRAELDPNGHALSDDGSVRIRVDRSVAPATATIETPSGYLHSHDAWITIEDALTDDDH